MKSNQNDTPLVSIYCLSYNHEKYIRDTLDGIIAQEVNFKYEVIVHDDASTDGSQDIIREYAAKYPDIIKPILQVENQYSKGGGIFAKYILPNLSGKYTAICECDDYWTDPHKLQKQVDVLEGHPNVSICGHAFDTVNSQKELLYHSARQGKGTGCISVEEVIMRKDLPQTATVMYRTQLRREMPDLFKHCSVGDYPLFVYMATKGDFYYLDEVMSCYRRHGNGSWVTRMKKNDEVFDKHMQSIIDLMVKYNDYTEKKYENSVNMRISHCQFMSLERYGKVKQFAENEYFQSLNFVQRSKKIFLGYWKLLKK